MEQSKSFFDDVKKEVECPVCQEQFGESKEPKILKCFHTFCKSCLKGWLRQQRKETLSCPTCRTKTECPNNDIDSLPSNLFYKQMVEIVEAYTGQEESSCCGKCDEQKSLKFYCSNCNCLLCEECAAVHKKWKDFRGHQLKEIGKLQSHDVEDYSRRGNVCKEHDDEFRFFCLACRICICRDCAILDHDDHKKISLEKGLENKTTEIKNRIKEVQSNGSHLRSKKESLEKRRSKVIDSFERATNSVRVVAEQWITFIRKHETDITEKLMKQKDVFEAEFSNQMSSLDDRLVDIESSLHFGEEILSRKNLPEILNVEEMLENRLQELSVPFEPTLDFPEVMYNSNDFSCLKDGPGKLIRTVSQPTVSVVKDQGLTEAVEGEESTFTVITKDIEGQIVYSEALRMEEDKCSLEKDDVIIDKDNEARGIYVTGFPSDTKANELVIHFQKRKHGGGDIECIHITEKRFAVIIFDDRSVAESVVKMRQFLGPGKVPLKVESFSEKLKNKTAKTPKIFRRVMAWIHDEVLRNHYREEIELILNKVKEETEIEVRDASEGFLLSGSFQQVKQSRDLFSRYLGNVQNLDLRPSISDESEKKRRSAKHPEKCSSPTSSETDKLENEKEAGAVEGSGNEDNFEVEESSNLEPQQYETTQKFFPLFVRAHGEELQKIEKDFRVKVHREAVDNIVTVAPTRRCTVEEFDEGCDAFITLYQDVHKRMKLEQFIPRDEEAPARVRQLITDIGKAHPVLVEKCDDRKHWKVYGEDCSVDKFLSDLLTEGLINRTAPEPEHWNKDWTDEGDDDSDGGDSLEHKLGSVKLSVMKGDITDQQVDAIVNAANTRLDHGAGVAGAIIKKGGYGIQKESDNYIHQHGLLNDGEVAMTRAGKLPCKRIIHAVGPMWRKAEQEKCRKALRMACLESLTAASGKKCKSIAFPAISSGIYGMPKDVCAKVMFDAVKEYVTRRDPSKSTLIDIRFVNNDDLTVKVFKKEFTEFFQIQKDNLLTGGPKTTNPSRPKRGKKKETSGMNDVNDPLSLDSNSSPMSFSDALKGKRREEFVGEKGPSASSEGAGKDDECAICLDTVKSARSLKCKHAFCTSCVETALKYDNRCPVCKEPQGAVQGNQPKGEMRVQKLRQSLPGYKGCGAIYISYNFPNGTQGPEHPNPGQRYFGTSRSAYLPDNQEGREVLALLKRAFDARLVFTVGTSVLSGLSNQITWNDIHHKTNTHGGPQGYGYPDPDYLRRVKEDLAAKGIR